MREAVRNVPGGRSAPLTQERLRHLFSYNEQTGIFTRNFNRGGYAAGAPAGYRDKDGYITICIDQKKYRAQNLAWLWAHGYLPDEIDHADLDRSNNRLANLRRASRSLNNANHPCRVDNRLGVKGAQRVRGSKRYLARIKARGKSYYLGTFDSPQNANGAYFDKAQELFGEFARAQ